VRHLALALPGSVEEEDEDEERDAAEGGDDANDGVLSGVVRSRVGTRVTGGAAVVRGTTVAQRRGGGVDGERGHDVRDELGGDAVGAGVERRLLGLDLRREVVDSVLRDVSDVGRAEHVCISCARVLSRDVGFECPSLDLRRRNLQSSRNRLGHKSKDLASRHIVPSDPRPVEPLIEQQRDRRQPNYVILRVHDLLRRVDNSGQISR
jgi:hypothetical protein